MSPRKQPAARTPRRPGDQVGRPAWVVGAIVAGLIAIASYLAFTKELPFTGAGYELHATFENAATLRTSSPVRIAGVKVGEVTDVQPAGDAAEVTFTVDDIGQPIHEDAAATIRPRLFLEGNFFVDLRPGSPSAPELPGGSELPMTQTSTAVQLDQVLTSLQSGSRRDLQVLLKGYGTGLTYEPTAADDATQDEDVQGESAAESVNDSFKYGGKAGKGTAIVNEALLGREPHDLSGLIKAQRDVFTKLEGHEAQLQGLITNFNVTTGALAQEQANVSASVRELAPTLEEAEPSLRHLSDALPPLRAWARVTEPSLRALPGTIEAAGPWLDQAKLLLRDRELGGLARLLGTTAKPLAQTSHQALRLLPELNDLSRCVTDVLEPTGNIVTGDSLSSGESNFHEFFYAAVNLAGAGQSFDGNGQYVRAQTGGGPQLVQAPNPVGSSVPGNTKVYGNVIDAPDGVQPALPATQPPFEMGTPCRTNPVPDINGPAGAAAAPDLTPAP